MRKLDEAEMLRGLSYWWMVAAVVAYPALCLSTLYSTWAAAWFTLGYVPRASLDDPKSIGWLVTYYHTATTLLMLLFPLGLIVSGLGIVPSLENRTRHGRLITAALVALAVASWAILVCLVVTDHGGVVKWFMD